MLRIHSICKEKGMTLQELAANLGITYQSLYESIKGNPSLKRLQEIASALGVEVIDLFEKEAGSTHTCPHCGKPINITLE